MQRKLLVISSVTNRWLWSYINKNTGYVIHLSFYDNNSYQSKISTIKEFYKISYAKKIKHLLGHIMQSNQLNKDRIYRIVTTGSHRNYTSVFIESLSRRKQGSQANELKSPTEAKDLISAKFFFKHQWSQSYTMDNEQQSA